MGLFNASTTVTILPSLQMEMSCGLLSSVKMDRTELAQNQQIRCDGCSQITPSYEIVHYGSLERGYRQLCSQCFNALVAELDGLDGFENAKFEPVGLADCTGEVHEFHFRSRLFGPGVALDAFELRDGYPAGYQFQIIGDPTDDLLVLLGRLIERIRRALSVNHIVGGALGPQIADHRVVRGLIEWDDAYEGRLPRLVIDGREVTWEDFGRMLMTYEGWQFKLNLHDKSEEV
jgi:hypothetical protein